MATSARSRAVPLLVARRGARSARSFSSESSSSYSKLTTGFSSRISNVQESFFYPVRAASPPPPARSANHQPQRPPARVVVNVPATTANLGPGFDSFGFALDVWNRVIVQKSDRFEMVVEGEGEGRISLTEDNLVVQCVRKVLHSLGKEMPPLRFECQNAVPPTRGMGSSSAALVAGLAAGLALGGKDVTTPANKKLLLQLAANEEGHADNVAPAIYGGFQARAPASPSAPPRARRP